MTNSLAPEKIEDIELRLLLEALYSDITMISAIMGWPP